MFNDLCNFQLKNYITKITKAVIQQKLCFSLSASRKHTELRFKALISAGKTHCALFIWSKLN